MPIEWLGPEPSRIQYRFQRGLRLCLAFDRSSNAGIGVDEDVRVHVRPLAQIYGMLNEWDSIAALFVNTRSIVKRAGECPQSGLAGVDLGR